MGGEEVILGERGMVGEIAVEAVVIAGCRRERRRGCDRLW
jgi:hypothetical protein